MSNTEGREPTAQEAVEANQERLHGSIRQGEEANASGVPYVTLKDTLAKAATQEQ